MEGVINKKNLAGNLWPKTLLTGRKLFIEIQDPNPVCFKILTNQPTNQHGKSPNMRVQGLWGDQRGRRSGNSSETHGAPWEVSPPSEKVTKKKEDKIKKSEK